MLGPLLDRLNPELIINPAAYTAVDRAEDEFELAHRVNAEAPAALGHWAARHGVPIVHFSSDYVFDGSGNEPFVPDAPTAPLGAYGRSKLKGEQAVRESGAPHAILRTSWVFSAHGSNFVKSMLRLSQTRDRLAIVADQIGGPTPAGDIAEACVTVAEALREDPGKSGTYHFSGAPNVSWADFAREIFRQADKSVTVEDIPSSAYPTPAKRPANSRLDCSALSTFGIGRPDWKTGLARVLGELEMQ
jgi:dTDP-4-dehydrorhamnose reductase